MKKLPPWARAWLLQGILMLLLALVIPLSTLALSNPTLAEKLGYWLVFPLAGAASALFVTLRGLNPYAAWIAPPVSLGLIPWLITGFPPPFGSVLLTAFVGLIAAATGDVIRKRT